MAGLSQAARPSLQKLATRPASAVAALLYTLALAAAGLWAARAVLLHPSAGASTAEWELVCMGEEVARRKCVLALGGRVHEGLYLFAAGGQVQGVVAIGQVAVGLIAIGWVALGGLLAVVRDAVTSAVHSSDTCSMTTGPIETTGRDGAFPAGRAGAHGVRRHRAALRRRRHGGHEAGVERGAQFLVHGAAGGPGRRGLGGTEEEGQGVAAAG